MSINTPALLFPAITLLMLAYTNRFLALATLIRNLHSKYKQGLEEGDLVRAQIHNLKRRIWLFRSTRLSSAPARSTWNYAIWNRNDSDRPCFLGKNFRLGFSTFTWS